AAVLYSEVRGEEPVVRVPEGAESVLLTLDINTPQAYPGYNVEVQSASGRSVVELAVPGVVAGSSLHVLVPASKLELGSHTLIVRGRSAQPDAGKEPEIGRYRFQVQRTQSD
ncbi:MAG: hypothetical protein ACRD7E_15685, partial [Bryobacteraceae bacterium]